MGKNGYRVITVNRKAFHDYDVLETVEAGLVLTGTEIKSVRAGRVNLRDAYARQEKGEMWLFNSHIAHYVKGGIYNHEPSRPRKLLLHRSQIDHLALELGQKRLTVVPCVCISKTTKPRWSLASPGDGVNTISVRP